MLSKSDSNDDQTRQEWRARMQQEIRQSQARNAEHATAKPIIDMAEHLYNLVFYRHNIELMKLMSPLNPERKKIEGNDELIAARYKVLSLREKADDDILCSLMNARYGQPMKLGERLIPELKALADWRRKNPVTGNPEDALAHELDNAIAQAEQLQFVQKVQERADNLARSGLSAA